MYLMEEIFKEYDETTGVGDLLFVNKHKLDQYRFYRRRNEWDECYMVEFCKDSCDYQLYWGHNDSDRDMIDVTTLLSPQDPEIEWKRIKFEPLLAYNLPTIVESTEKTVTEQIR